MDRGGLLHRPVGFAGDAMSRVDPGVIERAKHADPIAFLHARGLLGGRIVGQWADIRCPVHKNGQEAHRSMRVNLRGGFYRCMVCGEKGGDLIALHRLMTGATFAESVRELAGGA